MSNILQQAYTIKKDILFTKEIKKKEPNHGLVFKKVHRIIKFNQESWIKSYIDMNAEFKKLKK